MHASKTVFPQEVINDGIRYVLWQLSSMKGKPRRRLFQNIKMYGAKTWQHTALQEFFQLTVAQGSSGKSTGKLSPVHRRKKDKSFSREATHDQG